MGVRIAYSALGNSVTLTSHPPQASENCPEDPVRRGFGSSHVEEDKEHSTAVIRSLCSAGCYLEVTPIRHSYAETKEEAVLAPRADNPMSAQPSDNTSYQPSSAHSSAPYISSNPTYMGRKYCES